MSWAHDLTKAQRRELRRIAGLAHDRELAVALTALEDQFRRWRAGEIEVHDLKDAIHQFHQGPSRQLWLRYSDAPFEFAALYALQSGVVSTAELAPDIAEILKPRLDVGE